MVGKNKGAAVSTANIGTIIGPGAVFDGNITAPETIRIDGTLNGNCTCKGNLILGTEGVIDGNISAKNATLSGKLTGDSIIEGKLELFSTAKVAGNITASSLIIDENAVFDGRCSMATAKSNMYSKEPLNPEKNQDDTKDNNTHKKDEKNF